MGKFSGIAGALVSVACGLLWSFAALAQAPAFIAPPIRPSVDENGVELLSGQLGVAATDLTIGQPGAGGLSYTRYFNGSSAADEYVGAVTNDNSGCTYQYMYYFVTIGGSASNFKKTCPSGTTYTSAQGDGSTLTENASSYTYTARDGTVAVFSKSLGPTGPYGTSGNITSLTLPNGEVRTYNYVTGTICTDAACSGTYAITRLQSVTNNRGYQIKYIYQISSTASIPASDRSNWFQIAQVMGINMAVDYCAPLANSCPGMSQSWPTVSYGIDGTATDQLGGVTRHYYDTENNQFRIRWRNSPVDNVVYTLSYTADYSSTYVSSVSKNGRGWAYSYTWAVPEDTTVVYDSQYRHSTYVFDTATRALKRYTNTADELTTYDNDSMGRPTLVTLPTGQTVHYQHDARGNVTETRATSSPAGSPDLVWTAGYDATCSAPKKCNKPNWTKDAANNQTNYTYGTAHGSVTSVTLPAMPNGIRPATNYTYTAYAAYYKNSSGGLVAGSNVYYLTRVMQCRTTSGCTASSNDALRTDITYGQSNVGNNRLPVTLAVRDGPGTLTATTTTTYDSVGNVTAVDGPLGGTVDKVVTQYDVLRRVIGTVSPDPDDTGPRLNLGVRTTYNAQGLPRTIETGNISGQVDVTTSSFVPSQSIVREFDADGRVTMTSLVAGGTYAVQQVSFDTLGRVDCSVTRMNPAYFGSLPQSACTAGSAGPFGPDRITKYSYDAADRVTSVVSGFGQPDAITESSTTYFPGGRLQTLADGKGNTTTYSYDPYGRVSRVYYPSPSTPGVSSSTDYEEFTYDVNSQLTQTRRRSGDLLQLTRDALGRVTMSHVIGGSVPVDDVYFSYDNQGRPLSALYNNQAGNGITQTYDVLGRMGTRTVFGRQLGYHYDLAGRRDTLTYPDGFYVSYGYTNTNELQSITDSAGTVLATYGYDGLGARTGLSRANGAATGYTPDAIKQLHQLTQTFTGSGYNLTASFAYNPAGQISSRTMDNEAGYSWMPSPPNNTVTASVDGQNQLTSFAGTTVTRDGNTDVRTGINNLTYTFDALGELRQATGGSSTVTVDYDPAGMLRRVTAGSTVTDYLYDGGDLVAQYDGSGNLIRRFVHGAGSDEPLVSYDAAGNKTWLHADERGSIVAASNASGAALGTVKYSSDGESGALVSPFGYTGQLYLPELQLYYYKARMYSPKAGRFLQPDPIGYAGGPNLYAYVGGDPINSSDTLGLEANHDIGCTVDAQCLAEVTISASRMTMSSGGGLVETPTPTDASLGQSLQEVTVTAKRIARLGGIRPPQGNQQDKPKDACPRPELEAEGRFGLYGQFMPKLFGALKAGVDINAFRINVPVDGPNYMDQGVGVGAELFGFDLWLGVQRISTNGGLSWSKWDWYGAHDKLSFSDEGLSLGLEGGVVVGGALTVTHLESILIPCAN